MKKILAVLTALSLIGAAQAQKKAKPVATAAARVDAAKADADAKAKAAQGSATAKATDAQNKLNENVAAATAVDETKFAVSVWGGYGIAMKSDFSNYPSDKFVSDSQFTTTKVTGTDNKLGGVAGGLDLFYGSKFQVGAGAAYLKGMDNTTTLNETTLGNASVKTKLDFLPFYAQARYFLIEGLYVGAGIGLASVLSGSQTVTMPSGGPADGKVSYTGSLIAILGKVGYSYKINQNISVGVLVNVFYLTGKIPALYYDAVNNPVTKDVTANQLTIAPAVSLTYAF